METIIGLLFVLLPVIFKLIGKKLEQSGQSEKAGMYDWLNGPDIPAEKQQTVTEPEPIVQEPVVTEFVNRTTVKPKNASARQKPRKKPILEEEAVVKKEKIDPKKLVVYSEIMKPKYTEKY